MPAPNNIFRNLKNPQKKKKKKRKKFGEINGYFGSGIFPRAKLALRQVERFDQTLKETVAKKIHLWVQELE